jgi:6-methylsalicylate decarboxylase
VSAPPRKIGHLWWTAVRRPAAEPRSAISLFSTSFLDNALQCFAMRSVDVHQHLWPEGVLRVLERRSDAPRATWRDERWRVELVGEPAFDVYPRDHDPNERSYGLSVDRALVALSAPVGAERTEAADALNVIAAWQDAAKALPENLGWWAATPSALAGGEEAELAVRAIADGAAGLCLPADRLATPASARVVLPLLAAVAEAGVPVFVHPGPVQGGSSEANRRPVNGGLGTHSAAADHEPAWWSPATHYVAQQHAAWLSFHEAVRPELPTLRAIFALLAGLAPLHAERVTQRGRPATEAALADPLTFYDTSSYGPRAVRAMATAVGIGQLVHGTDYPVATPEHDPVQTAFGDGFAELVKTQSAHRALGYTWVPA